MLHVMSCVRNTGVHCTCTCIFAVLANFMQYMGQTIETIHTNIITNYM